MSSTPSATKRAAHDLAREWVTWLRPVETLPVSAWAERHRVLVGAAQSGKWRNSVTPYLVEIMDALSPESEVQEVVLMKSARVGGTEVMNNVVGAFMDQAPSSILSVHPTESDAEEWSKDALDPMVQSSPRLKGLVSADAQRKKGNTILHKRFRGGAIYIVGASSAKSFRRRTTRLVLGDEVDGYPGALAGEGDPVDLARERSRTFTFTRKHFFLSTPTVRGASRIEAAFLGTDRRYYHVPCPECGHLQRLIWSQVRWQPGELDEEGRPLAEYVCVSCTRRIPHRLKSKMLELGEWRPTNPGTSPLRRGYHISALYSPWMSWAEMAAEFLDVHQDPERLRVFVNTKLGETFDTSDSDAWDVDSLLALREDLPELPSRVAVLTAGVDVQDDRLCIQVDAWGPDEERWTVERRDLLGDPSGPEVWAQLDDAIRSRYPLEGGGYLPIAATCIDTGGHHTQAAYRFVRGKRKRRVFAIKGRAGEGRPVWTQRPSRKNSGKVDLYFVGVDAAKETMHARLRRSLRGLASNERGGPGFWHFAARPELGRGYFDELTAEVQVVSYANSARHGTAPRRAWHLRPGRPRNEGLDLSVYSYAALHALYASNSVDLSRPATGRDGGAFARTMDGHSEGSDRAPLGARPSPPKKASPPSAPAPFSAHGRESIARTENPAPARPTPPPVKKGKRPRWF